MRKKTLEPQYEKSKLIVSEFGTPEEFMQLYNMIDNLWDLNEEIHYSKLIQSLDIV